MEEKLNNKKEQEIAQVGDWISTLSHERRVGRIEPEVLKGALVECGANFEISEKERDSLGKYSNKARSNGMRAVWGDRFQDYKDWSVQYIDDYESTGNTLPALQKSGRKNSGMIQFFGQLTSFAAGELSFEDFTLYTESRALNGWLWRKGRKDERVRVKLPTSENPKLLSSFPPEFPSTAWEKIKSFDK